MSFLIKQKLMKRKEERCVRFVITVVTIQRHLVFYSDHIVGIGIALQWHCIKITTRSFISQLRGHLPIAIATLLNIDEKMLSSAQPITGMLLARAQSFGKCIQSWSKSKCTKSSMGELIIGWFRLTLHCTNSWRTYLQFWVHPPQGFVFSQYQRGVSLMLNIWCFCKTFVRPSTRDCQQQPCFLTQIPTRHQIISAGGAFFFHS